MEIVEGKFPARQHLAGQSQLQIRVRNADDKEIPNVAVTVNGFEFRKDDEALADNERPQFVVNGLPREIGGLADAKDATPLGCETSYVNTWACGRLRAGDEKSFRWSVTAVRAGKYRIRYSVAAGLNGKAKAVTAGSRKAPRGSLTGTVSDEPPDVRVGEDGRTVVEGTR